MTSRLSVIRATQEQTAILKAAYAVSPSPSSQGIQELSQQTGLPSKWIGRWFSRQRAKTRKASEVIDLTVALGEPTTTTQLSAPATVKIKAEYQEAQSLPPPTLDRTTAARNSTGPKSTRRRGPLPKKPQVKKAAVQDNTTPKAGPHLRIASEAIKNSIHPQNTFGCSTDASMASIYNPYGYFSPLDAQSTSSCSVSYNDYSDPLSTEGDAPYEKSLDYGSERPSSPASSDIKGPITAQVQPLTNSGLPCGLPLSSTESLLGQPDPRNIYSQALALHASLHNNGPAAYHAMLSNCAALLPALLPALTSMVASTSPIGFSGAPALVPSAPYPRTGVKTPLSWETQIDDIPRLPPLVVDDDINGVLKVNSPLPDGKQVQNAPWVSDSDNLDPPGLYYDYAPLGHLQDRLEPFRLPESTYLFGREAVGNHLLEESLAVEEPFQAAMGLVLLSKLGLRW